MKRKPILVILIAFLLSMSLPGTASARVEPHDFITCGTTISFTRLLKNNYQSNTMGTYKTGAGIFKWMLQQGDATLAGQAPVINNNPHGYFKRKNQNIILSASIVRANGFEVYLSELSKTAVT
jgi:hypothetical protein